MGGKELLFLYFGFEGSQAVPIRPSGRGAFERMWSFEKRKGMMPKGNKLRRGFTAYDNNHFYIMLEVLHYREFF
jgi:hypothetical protein